MGEDSRFLSSPAELPPDGRGLTEFKEVLWGVFFWKVSWGITAVYTQRECLVAPKRPISTDGSGTLGKMVIVFIYLFLLLLF